MAATMRDADPQEKYIMLLTIDGHTIIVFKIQALRRFFQGSDFVEATSRVICDAFGHLESS